MLLHVSCPSVIIECGFLSNWREATNLADDYYQETIATAIASALQQYCSDS
jgi:N-acetylmuramoyl-L-alanine amidase